MRSWFGALPHTNIRIYIHGEWLAVRGDWFYFHFLIDFNGFRTAPTCSSSRPFSSQWTPSFASKSWGDSLMEWKQISTNYKWADTRSASSSSKPWFWEGPPLVLSTLLPQFQLIHLQFMQILWAPIPDADSAAQTFLCVRSLINYEPH